MSPILPPTNFGDLGSHCPLGLRRFWRAIDPPEDEFGWLVSWVELVARLVVMGTYSTVFSSFY